MHRTLARTLLGLFAVISIAAAQTTGVIEGLVLDPTSAPVSKTAVKLIHTATNSTRTLATDDAGRFVSAALPPGTYRIEVSATGFRTAVHESVALSAGRTTRVDFALQVGEVRETLIVESTPELVSTSAADWGGTISRRQLAALPLNGRDLFDLAAQQPGTGVATHAEGAMFNGLGAQLAVNGNRPNQNSFRMDGVYLNDGAASAPASAAGRLLGVEAIEELRLIANPFSAEFGKAASAVLTAVSRSGGNDWHGSAYYYLRHNSLDAKNFFDSPADPIPPLRRNQFGGLLSGPVATNRFFFLANFEAIRETRGRTQRSVTLNENARLGILPSGNVTVAPAVRPYLDLYPLPNGRDFGDGTAEFTSEVNTTSTEHYGTGRADYLISPRLRTSAHLTLDGARNSNPDAFHLWELSRTSRFAFVYSQTEFVQSPHTLHSFRAGYSRVRNHETGTPPDIPESLSFVPGRPIGNIEATGLGEVTDRTVGGLPRLQVLEDYQFNYDVSHLRGAHTIRAGAGYDRLRFRQLGDFNANGRYIFSSIPNFLQGIVRSADLMSPESDTARLWSQHQYYFFVQDQVRLRSNINLTLGVRYEGYKPPSEADNKIATLRDPLHDTAQTIGGPLFDNPSAANFAPRAALAWSPFASRRTVIRAGAGMFFDLLTSREVTIAGMRVPPYFNRVFLTAPAFPDLLAAVQSGRVDQSLDGLAYDMQQPYVLQFRFSVEHQFDRATSIEAGYAGSRGVHLIGQFGDFNISQPQRLADGRYFFTQGGPLRNPAFGRIGLRSSDYDSVYHALLLQLRRNFASGFSFQTSYTWSKAIDNSSSSTNTEFDNSDRNPFPHDLRFQRGPADFDVRHMFTANITWNIPGRFRGWQQRLLGGWEINTLIQAQTGFPFNPRTGFDRTRLQSSFGDLDQRPSLAASRPDNIILGDPARYFDPTAFELQEPGYYGNLGRNALTGPGLFSLNTGLHKLLWSTERHQVRFRAEAFNLTNHPNFDLPSSLTLFGSNGARVGAAGRITTTSTSARQIQLALRWAF